jgi:hypothetical protein
MKKRLMVVVAFLALSVLFPTVRFASAQDTSDEHLSGDAELAQELSNPIADLVSVPIQMNYDQNIGPVDDGWKLQTNIQPVIPFHLNENWNLISRTIVPVIYQEYFSRLRLRFRSGRHQSEPVFFAQKARLRLPVMGGRTGAAFPNGHGVLAGQREMGRGTGGGCAGAAGIMDRGCFGQPCLVLCRRQ